MDKDACKDLATLTAETCDECKAALPETLRFAEARARARSGTLQMYYANFGFSREEAFSLLMEDVKAGLV